MPRSGRSCSMGYFDTKPTPTGLHIVAVCDCGEITVVAWADAKGMPGMTRAERVAAGRAYFNKAYKGVKPAHCQKCSPIPAPEKRTVKHLGYSTGAFLDKDAQEL